MVMGVLHVNKEEMSHIARSELSYEIIEYKQLLKELKINVEDLTRLCPKDVDARQDAIKVAKIISDNKWFLTYIREKKKLPIRELKKFILEHHKTVKKYRKYVMAISVIYMMDFIHIQAYLNIFTQNQS